MSEKYIDSRIINKHDTEANWQTHSDFIPLVGEIIVYDRDSTHNYQRVKVGDGVTNVGALPFINENLPIANGDNYGVIKSNDIATIANGVVTNISKANRLENSDGIKTTMINYETQFGLEETLTTTKEDGTSIVYGYSPRVDKTTGNILIKTSSEAGDKWHTVYTHLNPPVINNVNNANTATTAQSLYKNGQTLELATYPEQICVNAGYPVTVDGEDKTYELSLRAIRNNGNVQVKTVTDSGTKFHTLYSDQNKPSANVIQGLDTYLWNFLTSNEFILDCNAPEPIGE